jgi:hypothetical protein
MSNTGVFINPNFYLTSSLQDGSWTNIVDASVPNAIVQEVSFKGFQDDVLFVGDFTALLGETSLEGVLTYDIVAATFNDIGADAPAGSFTGTRPFRGTYAGGTDGDIYVFGHFTAKGATTIRKFAKWDSTPETWSEPDVGLAGGGATADVGKLLPTPDGLEIYIGGDFLTDGPAVVEYNYIARYNIATDTIAQMQAKAGDRGLNGIVYDMVYGQDGRIYICGAFTATDAGAAALRVVKYDKGLDEFVLLGTGISAGIAYHIAQGKDGFVYVAHGAGGVADTIARWNGNEWSAFWALESGGSIAGMVFDDAGIMHVTGDLYNDGNSVQPAHGRYYLRISQNVFFDGPIPSTVTNLTFPQKTFFGKNGKMAVTTSTTSSRTFISEVETTVSNNGSAESYPIIRIENATTLIRIVNETVGASINFGVDFTVGDTEILYIDFEGEQPRIYSNYRNDLSKYLLPGTSNLRDFRLLPGDNKILVSAVGTSSDEDITVVWRETYHSIDPVNA